MIKISYDLNIYNTDKKNSEKKEKLYFVFDQQKNIFEGQF